MARFSNRLGRLFAAREAAAFPAALPPAVREQAEALHRLAQLVTPDAAEAAALVEATYRRVPHTLGSAEGATLGDLAALMESVRYEHARVGEGSTPHLAAEAGPGLAALRQTLAERAWDRLLPPLLATLPQPERLLLAAVDGEGLSPKAAGALLDLPEDLAALHLHDVRRRVLTALRASASTAERRVLPTPHTASESAIAEALGDALHRVSLAHLAPFPADLATRLAPHVTGTASETRAAQAPSFHPTTAAEAFRAATSAPSTPRPERLQSPAWRWSYALLAIVSASLIGLFGSRLLDTEPESNLVVLTAEIPPRDAPSFVTASAETAEEHVWLELGRRVTVPEITGATLAGVSIEQVKPGFRAPAFYYAEDGPDDSTTPIVLYAYTYVQLEGAPDQVRLDRTVLAQIEDDGHFYLYDPGEENVLLWRHRDDIFAAVFAGDAEAMQERLRFPN